MLRLKLYFLEITLGIPDDFTDLPMVSKRVSSALKIGSM
jgi:hypothetical protein